VIVALEAPDRVQVAQQARERLEFGMVSHLPPLIGGR
jgi:hypothetical protein